MLGLILLSLPDVAWPIFGISMMIAIFIAVIFQLAAAFFQSPRMKAVANEELAALLFTLVIIGFFLACDAFLHGIVTGIMTSSYSEQTWSEIQGMPTGHLDVAILQTEIFVGQFVNLYLRLAVLDVFVSFMSTLSFNLGMLPGGIGIFSVHIAPYVPLSLVSQALTKVVDGIGMLALAVWAKQMILIFAKTVVPLIFLPLGIILRANPFSRTTGSSIIAIAFALYFIFPIIVMISYYMIFDIYGLEMSYSFVKHATAFKTEMDIDEMGTWDPETRSGTGMVGDIYDSDSDIRSEHETSLGETPEAIAEDVCGGNWLEKLFCSFDRMISDTPVIGRYYDLIKDVMKKMLDYSGGWLRFLFGEGSILLPTSFIRIIYITLVDIVAKTAELFVIVTITTIFEIMVTVTMYRNIALLIGGEPEIAGITKLV